MFIIIILRYYSAHRCSKVGCGSVLVLDGNMKNHRDVCAAEDAGFVEYIGLPGRVKTGCMESPKQCSKFCSNHMTHHAQCSGSSVQSQAKIVEMILRKKETRSSTLYEVSHKSTCVCSFD